MSTILLAAACTPLFPAAVFLALGLRIIFVKGPPTERWVVRLSRLAFGCSLLTSLAVCAYFVRHGDLPLHVQLGTWFGSAGYGFEASLLIDTLSAPMMALTAGLCGLVGHFSSTYLVREPGQARFYLLLCLFATGMLLLVMAGSLDLLIAGWELVGLSSMLLIAFFHERTFAVRNALRTFIIYRSCDIGLLCGTVLMHHYLHTASFADAFGVSGFSQSAARFPALGATLTCLCLLLAASGKSALFPVGSWLPRAMEGPTPSSAIFYGALSVHAGAYLLLRMHPLLASAPVAQAMMVALGVLTALSSTLAARVQSDVKSQLAWATSSQVGIIFVEIGLGLPRLALLHLIGHALVRTLQLLRAPNALADGAALRQLAAQAEETTRASRLYTRLYHLSLERFHLDAFWEHCLAAPVLRLGQLIEQLEARWFALLSGERPNSSPPVPRMATHQEERT